VGIITLYPALSLILEDAFTAGRDTRTGVAAHLGAARAVGLVKQDTMTGPRRCSGRSRRLAQSEIRTSSAAGSRLPLCFALSRMFTWLAYFVLRVHILKKAARLQLSERLAYLLMSRRVHGVLIVLWTAGALASAFVATCCIYPHFAVIIHLDTPADEAVPDVWTAKAFFMATGFFVVGTLLLFVTRRMLAAYWLLLFFTYYVRHEPSAENEAA